MALPHRVWQITLVVLAWLATAIGAWLPQFVFLSASFTNDALIIALAALAVYWLVQLVVRHGKAELVVQDAASYQTIFAAAPGAQVALDQVVRGVVFAWNRHDRRLHAVIGTAQVGHGVSLPLVPAAS